jgi:hypothetical protein
MAVTANEHRLNTLADLVILKEAVAFLMAQQMKDGVSDNENEKVQLAALTDRIRTQIESRLVAAGAMSAQNQTTEQRRYAQSLDGFMDGVRHYIVQMHAGRTPTHPA